MIRASASTLILIVLTCALGCSSSEGPGTTAAMPLVPAALNHPVYFKLNDPGEADALIADCNRLLRPIPGVVAYYVGRPYDSGRASVTHDYDVGLYIGFATAEDYSNYVDHPNHVALVSAWRDRLEWLRVHDILDETPDS